MMKDHEAFDPTLQNVGLGVVCMYLSTISLCAASHIILTHIVSAGQHLVEDGGPAGCSRCIVGIHGGTLVVVHLGTFPLL